MKLCTAMGFFAALAAAGCSPYVYKAEVTSVASGIGALQSAIGDARAGVAADVAEIQIEGMSAGRRTIALTDPCRDPELRGADAPACALRFPTDLDDATIIAAEDPRTVKAIDGLTAALGAYARALQAITNAQDRADLDAATGKLAASVTAIGKALSVVPGAAAAAAVARDAVTLAGQLIGASADRERYLQLKAGVARIDPLMDTIGGRVGDNLQFLAARRTTTLDRLVLLERDHYNALPGTTSQADRATELSRLMTHVAALDKASTVDGAAAGKALAKAHHDLNAALQANTGQVEALVSSLQAFATAADQLRSDLTATAKTTP